MRKMRLFAVAVAGAALMMAPAAMAAESETAATEVTSEAAADAVTDTAEDAESEAETEAEIPVRPSYKASGYVDISNDDYKHLTVEVEPVAEVTDDEIDSAIEEAVVSNDAYDQVKEGVVEDGDLLSIDFVGKKDGVEFDGGSAEDYELEIGSGTFIDGFEDGLIGKKVGDTVDLNLTFPEDYGAEDLAGQDVVFTVTINYKKVMPEFTDELADTLSDGEQKTMEEYRSVLRSQLEQTNEENHRALIDNAIMEKLYEMYPVTGYPQEMIDYMVAMMKETYQQYAAMYGMEFPDFLTQYLGMDEETFETNAEEAAKSNMEQELILKAIAEKEGIDTFTEEEYQKGCEDFAEMYGYGDVETFQSYYDRETIEISLLMQRVLDELESTTTVVDLVETEADAGSIDALIETEAETEAETAESATEAE